MFGRHAENETESIEMKMQSSLCVENETIKASCFLMIGEVCFHLFLISVSLSRIGSVFLRFLYLYARLFW